jgi:phosphate starvation-inducible PhoH-like protein
MGPSDVYLRRIEESFDALVTVRGSQVTLIGAADVVEQATGVFSFLIQLIEQGEIPTLSDVELSIGRSRLGAQTTVSSDFDILLTYRGRAIRPKTPGQRRYTDAIRTHTITFGLGPAGTGKTYLAMAMAVAALKRREVARIVLTRPVVEAGES